MTTTDTGPQTARQRYLQALMDEYDAYDWEQSGWRQTMNADWERLRPLIRGQHGAGRPSDPEPAPDPASYRPEFLNECGWIGVYGWLDNIPAAGPCTLVDDHEGPHERHPTRAVPAFAGYRGNRPMTESVRSAVNPSQIGAGDMTDRPTTEEARPDDGRWSRGGWHWLACWEQWSHDPERECVCDRLQRAATPVEHVPLQERIDALARALYTAGLARSDLDKDGLPRLIAEGVYANLRKVQHLDLVRPLNAKEWLARRGRSSDPEPVPGAMSAKSDALRLLNVIEQEATRASDKGEWLNAPWTVSLIREIRTALNGEAAAATEPRPDSALDVERLARAIEIEDDRLPFLDAGIDSTASPRAVAEQIADRYARLPEADR